MFCGPTSIGALKSTTSKKELYVCNDAESSPVAAPGGSPPAVGLTLDGEVYWGELLVAKNVASIATRQGTAPNPDYLLYTTRDRFLHTRAFADLASGIDSSEPLPAQK